MWLVVSDIIVKREMNYKYTCICKYLGFKRAVQCWSNGRQRSVVLTAVGRSPTAHKRSATIWTITNPFSSQKPLVLSSNWTVRCLKYIVESHCGVFKIDKMIACNLCLQRSHISTSSRQMLCVRYIPYTHTVVLTQHTGKVTIITVHRVCVNRDGQIIVNFKDLHRWIIVHISPV